jgi:uncharacterized membrane protein (DUF485 family)
MCFIGRRRGFRSHVKDLATENWTSRKFSLVSLFMSYPEASDLTPDSEAPTDIAPLGRTGAKPSHELTAAEEKNATDWDAIAAETDFKNLLVSKARFIVPATLFFVVYYFTLPVLVGWFPKFMEQKVVGEVNLAYLFALSQFFMAWIIAFLYLAAAAGWDRQAAALLGRFAKRPRR